MSALAINSLLDIPKGHMGNHNNNNLDNATIKSSDSSIIHRKHYSEAPPNHDYRYSHDYSGHSYTQNKKKSSRGIALTALTLLAFLFFLHILQQCLHDHMEQMNPQVVVMQARIKAVRENEEKELKEADKRIGELSEKTITEIPPKNKLQTINSAPERSENEYQYEKIQIPVKIKPAGSRRH